MNIKASVLISVYNAVRELELTLTGYSRQSFRDFEVVIGDDGSGPEIRSLVAEFSRHAPFPLKYVYQADEGFRKTRILNQALLISSAPYVVLSDPDCVPHRDFLHEHMDRREPRTVLCGRRVLLGPRISQELTPDDVRAGRLRGLTWELILDRLRGQTLHLEEGIRIRSPRLLRLVYRKEAVMFGCNYSLERSLLEEVNGYNEELVEYWGEDEDLQHRLRRAGAHFRWIRNCAITYHLHHPRQAKSERSAALVAQTRRDGIIMCRQGLREAAERRAQESADPACIDRQTR